MKMKQQLMVGSEVTAFKAGDKVTAEPQDCLW